MHAIESQNKKTERWDRTQKNLKTQVENFLKFGIRYELAGSRNLASIQQDN